MFDRFISLVGIDNFNKIKNKNIVIIGIGGVGGYTFEALIRSGIKNITIIDNDSIEQSNLNRQIITNQNNIGNKKVEETKKRAKNINPEVNIVAYEMFLDQNNINILDNKKIDYIIDCCDSVNTKFSLIEYATKNNINIITCLGTAKKLHPEKLEISTLDKTSYDPLAKILRKKVKDACILKKIPVIYSKEIPIKTENNILGSSSFVPGSAGLLIASYVINDILKNGECI